MVPPTPTTTTPTTSTPNYKPQLILSGHKKSISSVKFSPDGNFLASAGVSLSEPPIPVYRPHRQGADKLIKIWDATTGDIIQTLAGHSEGISDIAWSAHSDYIASASDDNTVRIWNLDASRCISYLIVLLMDVPIGFLGEDTERAHELRLLCELQSKVQPLSIWRI